MNEAVLDLLVLKESQNGGADSTYTSYQHGLVSSLCWDALVCKFSAFFWLAKR